MKYKVTKFKQDKTIMERMLITLIGLRQAPTENLLFLVGEWVDPLT
jgi:hypothetical protein